MPRSSLFLLALLLVGCGSTPRPSDDGVREPFVRAGDDGPPPVRDAGIPDVVFVNVAEEAGLTHVRALTGATPFDYAGNSDMLLSAGAVAVGDVDDDGWPDLYFTRSGDHGLLYRNRGDGTFGNVTAVVGLDVFRDTVTNGAAFADVDRDGDLDLYVTTIGAPDAPETRYLLFLQGEDGRFTEVARERGAAIETDNAHGGMSVAVGDYDRDGWLDLHVTEWIGRGLNQIPHSRLLHNRGADAPGHYEDVTVESGLDEVAPDCWAGRECNLVGFASGFHDFDADGWADLLVVQDFVASQLYWNRGDGTFEQGTQAAGVGIDDRGMGSTTGDLDGDGDLDWFVAGLGETGEWCGTEFCDATPTTGNRLYRYDGERGFAETSRPRQLEDGGWGWGAALFDYDNDGDLDLIQTNGFIDPREDVDHDDHWNEDHTLFWRNDGEGVMEEVALECGVDDRGNGRGLVTVDYDRDGDLDVVIVDNLLGPILYRNEHGNVRSWLRVRLDARVSAPEGLGAVVRVWVNEDSAPLFWEMGSVTQYLGQSERVAHFGLGTAQSIARLEVAWPSGARSVLEDVEARQELTLTEPE